MDTKLPSLRDSNPLKITASGQIPESQAAKPTVFVSTGPIFPLKDTKCEMREVQQLYATSTRQTPWQTAIRKGPVVRILLFIRIPIIPSVICTISIANVTAIKILSAPVHTGIRAAPVKARLRANIYKAFVRLFPCSRLTSPMEKQSPKTALSKVVQAVK